MTAMHWIVGVFAVAWLGLGVVEKVARRRATLAVRKTRSVMESLLKQIDR